MIHENFYCQQDFNLKSLNYSDLEKYRQVLKELDTLGYQFHWMFDYAKVCFYYMTENPSLFPKREFAYSPGEGYKCLIENSHPEDVMYMLQIQKEALNFLFQQKKEDRLNYKFTCKFRILTKSGDYVPFNFQFKAIALDNKGNLWMSLALASPSRTENMFQPLIISISDQHFFYTKDIRHPKKEYSLPELTDRELEMIKLMGKNKNLDEICVNMQLAASTIKFHKRNLLKKLNAPNSFIAIENARLLGLL